MPDKGREEESSPKVGPAEQKQEEQEETIRTH